jgi:hypothetical protein
VCVDSATWLAVTRVPVERSWLDARMSQHTLYLDQAALAALQRQHRHGMAELVQRDALALDRRLLLSPAPDCGERVVVAFVIGS